MTLQSSGAISMGDMRTEFGISGAISMSDLYRGGSEVPTTAELTNAISSVSDSGYGNSGYSQRYNVGNLNTSNFGTGYYGGAFPFQFGYLINNQAASSSIQNSSASYIMNGSAKNATFDNIMFMQGTSASGQSKNFVHNITFARAGTYYVWGYDLDGFATISVSGANSGNITAVQNSSTYTVRSTMGVSANQTVTITITNSGERIVFGFTISTSNSTHLDKTISANTGVPSSGTIAFSDLYGASA
tara:strand:- start:152 stop:886 length:735 start_codon:yes stop_codon:yes gene_type:complete